MKNLKKFAALLLVGAMAVTSLFACAKSPKEKVKDAFKAMGTSSSSAALAKELGMTDIMEKIEDGAFDVGIKLALEDSDIYDLAMLTSGSIEAFIASDKDKVLMGAAVGYAATELVSAQLYADKNQVALALPGLLEKVVYVDISKDLEKQLEKSILMKQEGMEEFDINSITDMLNAEMKNAETDELTKYILAFEKETKAGKKFDDAIEVTELDKKEFEINGKDQKCEGFEIVVPEEAIIEFVEAAVEYYFSDEAKEIYVDCVEMYAEENELYDIDDIKKELDSYFEEIADGTDEVLTMIGEYISDLEAEMYIYDGQVVSLEAEMEITDKSGSMGVESFDVGFELECEGGDYGMDDNYTMSIKMMSLNMIEVTKETDNDGDEYKCTVTLGGMAMQDMEASAEFAIDKKSGDFEFNAVFDDGYDSILCTAEGALEVEKKESVSVELDSFKLTMDDSVVCELSGEYYVKADADAVKMPKGDKINILTDKQAEWDELLDEIEKLGDALYGILGQLN